MLCKSTLQTGALKWNVTSQMKCLVRIRLFIMVHNFIIISETLVFYPTHSSHDNEELLVYTKLSLSLEQNTTLVVIKLLDSMTLTIFELKFNSCLQVECFNQCCLMEYQCVTNTTDIYSFSCHANTQFCGITMKYC